MLPFAKLGVRLLRQATVAFDAPSFQPPPRNTRLEPDEAPTGSTAEREEYAPYQSCVHSHTLPLMSYRPKAFAVLPATARVVELLLLEYQATSPTVFDPE